jgi:hypothetical protein
MKLTRHEVYELAWSAPMTAIAKLLGISSVSLGKTCERRGIPTPERGYWQKVAAGCDVPPPPPLREDEVELPMPWERSPVVEAALARLTPRAKSEGQTLMSEAALIRQDGERATRPEAKGERELNVDPSSPVLAASGGGCEAVQPIPLNIDEAITLARRLDDLDALRLLTERALQASTALPAYEEDRIRDWVTRIRKAMRDLDPLRHLAESVRAAPTSAAGRKHGRS